MQRIVPSEVHQFLSNHFTEGAEMNAAQLLEQVGVLAGFLELYDRIPPELISLPEKDYAILISEIAAIRLAMDRYRGGNLYDELKPIVRALPAAWKLVKRLPDQFPSSTHDLAFIKDTVLRDMIANDVEAIRTALSVGEWKSGTILAGSCTEALLLYGLRESETKSTGSIRRGVAAVTWPNKAPKVTDPTDRSWDLFSYTQVAHALSLILAGTKAELEPARDYRNLIHPARTLREQVACDRGTAYVSAGAMEHVIRDLRKSL